MKLEFAVFAECAILPENGFINMLSGGIEWLEASDLPATCGRLSLLARFSFERGECDKNFECVVAVTDPMGNVLLPNLSVVLKPKAALARHDGSTSFTAHFVYDGLLLGFPGLYHFRFQIGDVQAGEAILEVRLRKST